MFTTHFLYGCHAAPAQIVQKRKVGLKTVGATGSLQLFHRLPLPISASRTRLPDCAHGLRPHQCASFYKTPENRPVGSRTILTSTIFNFVTRRPRFLFYLCSPCSQSSANTRLEYADRKPTMMVDRTFEL